MARFAAAALLLIALAAPAAGLVGKQHPILSDAEGSKSVTGAPLELCSHPGTALTGFTRDGHCQDLGDDDAGSHHVCIAMKKDFCQVTGQPNWCENDMPCMGTPGDVPNMCKNDHWCVCQWAFARYMEKAGGCDSID